MLSFRHIGTRENYTSAAGNNSGDVVVLAPASATDPGRVGVVVDTIAAGGVGQVQVEGVVELAKLATDAYSQGQTVYWDATNKWLTATSNTNVNAKVGRIADQAFAANSATAYVSLNKP